MMRKPVAIMMLLGWAAPAALGGDAPAGQAAHDEWEPVGLSGGGSMFAPAFSPVDPRRVMINCDMSAAYLSADSGLSWQMIHHAQLRGNTFCRPAFHPKDPRTIFAASGWSGRLKVTRDGGATWSDIGNLPAGLRGEIAIDPGSPDRMLVGAGEDVWRTTDEGRTWGRVAGPRGRAVGFHFDQSRPLEQRVCFAATTDGVWRSDDGGVSWTEKSAGLPWRGLCSFAGGSNARERSCVLYAAIPSRVQDGRLAGGVYRSTDGAERWEPVEGVGLNKDTQAADPWAMGPIPQYLWVLTTDVKPLTVYALDTNTGVKPPHGATVYRSNDGGKTWHATFHPDARFETTNVELDWRTAGAGQHYQERPFGAAICPTDPDRLVFCGSMTAYVTDNGGGSWRAAHTRAAASALDKGAEAGWRCNGLVVTTTWHYYIDPFDPRRRYIAYTDIGFARSLDAGQTWIWWDEKGWAPWQNTCYELAFDPEVRGRIWGAFSDVHDIPNDNIIQGRHRSEGPGGICLSTDFGATWKPSNEGLPVAPATSVVLDPRSRAGARTLYAGVFDRGVFKSTDDGKTWKKASRGLGTVANSRVGRVLLHGDGTLFALVTAKRTNGRFLPEGVGLYRSTDGAENWELANASHPLLWPKDFAVAPQESQRIYIGAADADGEKQGGLWRTTNGGTNWELLTRKGPQHFGAYVHPKRPGWIYTTLTEGAPGSGLWLSRDDGKTWTALDGLPFCNVQRVEFDPADDTVVYATTFGGSVWRGPADPLRPPAP